MADSLRAGLVSANERLQQAQTAVARAQAAGGGAADSALAHTAQCAIFTEALLASIKARLSEIKTAAK